GVQQGPPRSQCAARPSWLARILRPVHVAAWGFPYVGIGGFLYRVIGFSHTLQKETARGGVGGCQWKRCMWRIESTSSRIRLSCCGHYAKCLPVSRGHSSWVIR